MITRLARGLFAALLVAALIAVPVLAIRNANPPAAQRSPAQVGDAGASGEEDFDTDDRDEEHKGPPSANGGDGPPVGNAWGHRRGNDNNGTDGDDKAGNGPPWAREGDGPPFGNAWGYWLNKGGDKACERITTRMETHRGEGPPAHLRDRIMNELGCDLPD